MNTTDPLATLRRGLLEFAVLRSIGARRSYVADILARLDGTEFATREGTLYPLLGKLRRDGLVAHEWQESESGPPRKYYVLTDVGRERVEALQAGWDRIGTTLESLGSSE